MDVRDRARIAERAEAATVEGFVGFMAEDEREAMGAATLRIGAGLVVRMAAAPDVPYFSRALGFGLEEPLTGDVLDETVAFLAAGGGRSLLVQLAPQVETAEVLALLEDRGFARGGTWAKLLCAAGPAPEATTDLVVRRVEPDEAADMARVQIESMELPPIMEHMCGLQVTTPGWQAYGAFDGATIVSFGVLSMHGEVAQLAGAGTLPAYRRRGAQSALMAARIEDAARLGAEWVTAETGSETDENPNPSLHNMYRAGMDLLYHRRNWLLRLPPVMPDE